MNLLQVRGRALCVGKSQRRRVGRNRCLRSRFSSLGTRYAFPVVPDMMPNEKAGAASRSQFPLSAQQTNLARCVLRGEPDYLNHEHYIHPTTGGKTVMRLESEEVTRFQQEWETRPVGCIRSMNRAIAQVKSPERSVRYLLAAFDLEILMDRVSSPEASDDLVGIPGYLKDGYTDLGFFPSPNRREKILVDKERLSRQLVSCKRQAIEELHEALASVEVLRAHLREVGRALRESVGYKEGDLGPRRTEETVFLSDCVERRSVACRHLAMLMQLRLQECGISSRLAKGVMQLYGLKGRHAWNLVRHGGNVALVDVTFGEDDGPLVIVAPTLEEVYARATDLSRVYRPSPDTENHYQIRSSGSSSGRQREQHPAS